jgi:diaminohydroxyphosphoribosylaminopyrimidine deaminase/5-amino-6-(5-phosphoribosylamino)uracil reductase
VHRRAAEELNEHFLTYMRTGMPFVGIKVAQTLDGRIADAWGDSQWITGAAARTHAHKLRTTYDAILIGARTVQQDNPRLTVRRVKGKNPVRVVVDGRLSVQHTARVFNAQVSRTLLLTSVGALRRFPEKVKRLTRQGVDVIAVGNNVLLHPAAILRVLAHLNLSSVLIEGGSRTIGTFLDAGLVHKVHCFLAPRILGSGLSGWQQRRERRLSHALQLKQIKLSSLGHDLLIEGTLASYDH